MWPYVVATTPHPTPLQRKCCLRFTRRRMSSTQPLQRKTYSCSQVCYHSRHALSPRRTQPLPNHNSTPILQSNQIQLLFDDKIFILIFAFKLIFMLYFDDYFMFQTQLNSYNTRLTYTVYVFGEKTSLIFCLFNQNHR